MDGEAVACDDDGGVLIPVWSRRVDQSLIASGGSKAISVTVQETSADCPCSDAGTVGVDVYSISANAPRGVAVAIFVCAYPLVGDGTGRPAVAVAISADVLTADPARRIAVPISIYGAIAVKREAEKEWGRRK